MHIGYKFRGVVVISISSFFLGAVPVGATVITELTRTGLTGVSSEGGIVGGGHGQVDEFDVGRYIVVHEGLVLRARSGIKNGDPSAGNPGILYVDKKDRGIGVGSFLGHAGSKEISGGGPHGLELISFIFTDDPLLTDPKAALADTVTVQVNKFKARKDDLTVILYDTGGGIHTFGPSAVEPLLISAGGKERWNLDFASLPGIEGIGYLDRFDVQSGVLKSNGKLSGGHFYVSGVSYMSVPEPATLFMLSLGICAMGIRRRSCKRWMDPL